MIPIVITSAAAKDQLIKAKTLMEEMRQGMEMQRQNSMMMNAQDQMEQKDMMHFNEEKRRFDETNQSKIELERIKQMV